MKEFLTLFVIAIALSMDTFSLSLGIGTSNLSKRKCFLFSILVGAFHFFMPLLGTLLGKKLVSFFMLKSDFLLGAILIYLAITMFIEIIHPDEKEKKMNYLCRQAWSQIHYNKYAPRCNHFFKRKLLFYLFRLVNR